MGRALRFASSILIASVLLAPATPTRALPLATPRGPVERLAGARPGMTLVWTGIRVTVPQPGHGVWAEAMTIDGSDHSIGLETLPTGAVVVDGAAAGGGEGAGADGGQSPCADSAYTLNGSSWQQTMRWYFNVSSTPPGVFRANAEAALRAAATNITHGVNDCHQSDQVTATVGFQGTISRGVNISTSSGCLQRDGISVVGFGNLSANYIAMACWWTVGGHTVEADIRFNKYDYRWVANPGAGCWNRYVIEAVGTHEFGHVFGLAHVSEAQHPLMTMSPIIHPCERAEDTLGLGDLDGLETIY